jgi:hypothetical protein
MLHTRKGTLDCIISKNTRHAVVVIRLIHNREMQQAGSISRRSPVPVGRRIVRPPRFSNIGVLRRLAIDSGHASRSGSKAALRQTRSMTRGGGGGFVTINLRAVELTLSGRFTGNYLEDDRAGTRRYNIDTP